MPATPRTARERARAEITAEILDTARVHLARDGAAALSLRAIARDCGMVSSAVYRYVPSRDALLTRLIIEAYDSVGSAAEDAEAPVRRRRYAQRFVTVCHAVRDWALANPHEYALIYGSPVPGYAAPQDTVAPAGRVIAVLLAILTDVSAAGRAPIPRRVPREVAASIAGLREATGSEVSDDLLLRGLGSWGLLLGSISLELFGHLTGGVDESPTARRAFFDHQVRSAAADLGLADAA